MQNRTNFRFILVITTSLFALLFVNCGEDQRLEYWEGGVKEGREFSGRNASETRATQEAGHRWSTAEALSHFQDSAMRMNSPNPSLSCWQYATQGEPAAALMNNQPGVWGIYTQRGSTHSRDGSRFWIYENRWGVVDDDDGICSE
jgi:hypothetical protein